ncbi:MAG: GNAT family N-acetyltransferase [Tissierellia bacterium]|nr:GNAT family N-acetyltransferase [Tissierellia bacterium]
MIRVKMFKEIFYNELDNFHFVEKVNFDEVDDLASAMFDAYKNAPDYENDTLEDFKNEVNNIKSNLYGNVIEDASLCVKSSDGIIAAIFVADFKDEATMTYCFTKKEHQGRGLAEALIKASENKLRELGYDKFYLYLTLSNQDAYNLFDALGFTETEIK